MHKATIEVYYPSREVEYTYIIKTITRDMLLHEIRAILNGEELATTVLVKIEYNTREA